MTEMNVAREVRRWLDLHSGERWIDPRKVAGDLRGATAVTVAAELMRLTEEGKLVLVYRVVTPAGVLADGEFYDLRDIPPRLPDRFEQYFETDEADVQPFFKRAA